MPNATVIFFSSAWEKRAARICDERHVWRKKINREDNSYTFARNTFSPFITRIIFRTRWEGETRCDIRTLYSCFSRASHREDCRSKNGNYATVLSLQFKSYLFEDYFYANIDKNIFTWFRAAATRAKGAQMNEITFANIESFTVEKVPS